MTNWFGFIIWEFRKLSAFFFLVMHSIVRWIYLLSFAPKIGQWSQMTKNESHRKLEAGTNCHFSSSKYSIHSFIESMNLADKLTFYYCYLTSCLFFDTLNFGYAFTTINGFRLHQIVTIDVWLTNTNMWMKKTFHFNTFLLFIMFVNVSLLLI